MPINTNVTNEQITVSVGETQIDVSVNGGVGPTGNAGAAATVTVGTVTTGAPGSSASVVNAGTSSAAVLNFSIPAGATGATGPQGPVGPAGTTTWAGITDKPSTFPASSHTHDDRYYTEAEIDALLSGKQAAGSYAASSHTHVSANITDFTSAVIAAAPPTTNASLLTSGTLPDARLSANIARTSDVSGAVAALVNSSPAALDTLGELATALGNDANFSTTVTNALASKAPIASPTFTGTVSGITKGMVGLGNVDNTSDASKPVSTAQAAADSAVASAAAADATSKANAAQAAAVQRANHTGQQAIGTVTGLQAALDGKAAVSHTHSALTDITGLATVATSGSASDLSAGTVPIARLPVGQTAASVAAGNDARFTDARTPTSHASSHASGGSDAINIAAWQITSGVISTARLGSGSPSSANYLRGDGAWQTPTASEVGAASSAVVYEFTPTSRPAAATGSNGSYTLSLPSGAKAVEFLAIGGGGGGGSGRRGAAGSARFGGGGGGGGNATIGLVAASTITTSLTILTGSGGAGGAAVTTDDTNGNNGSVGGISSVTYNGNQCVQASPGSGAGGGTASAGTSGSSASNSPDTFRNTAGTGSSSVTATAGSAFVAAGLAACGGAAGGGISTGNTAYNGGTQFLPSSQSAITGILLSNQSGGNASTTAAGGSGASGPNYGYGGCGGGASANGFNSGAGGNGGPGYVRITVWF